MATKGKEREKHGSPGGFPGKTPSLLGISISFLNLFIYIFMVLSIYAGADYGYWKFIHESFSVSCNASSTFFGLSNWISFASGKHNYFARLSSVCRNVGADIKRPPICAIRM